MIIGNGEIRFNEAAHLEFPDEKWFSWWEEKDLPIYIVLMSLEKEIDWNTPWKAPEIVKKMITRMGWDENFYYTIPLEDHPIKLGYIANLKKGYVEKSPIGEVAAS